MGNETTSFTRTEILCITSVLIQIMEADGVIHPDEEAFMDRFYVHYNITHPEALAAAECEPLLCRKILLSMDEQKRTEALNLFIGLAEADGFVHPTERECIYQYMDMGDKV